MFGQTDIRVRITNHATCASIHPFTHFLAPDPFTHPASQPLIHTQRAHTKLGLILLLLLATTTTTNNNNTALPETVALRAAQAQASSTSAATVAGVEDFVAQRRAKAAAKAAAKA